MLVTEIHPEFITPERMDGGGWSAPGIVTDTPDPSADR
ncbi:hypothetical protein CEXT_353941, partial [Caerostris extrusa]